MTLMELCIFALFVAVIFSLAAIVTAKLIISMFFDMKLKSTGMFLGALGNALEKWTEQKKTDGLNDILEKLKNTEQK